MRSARWVPHVLGVTVAVLGVAPAPALAQDEAPAARPAVEIFSRSLFHMAAERIANADPRLDWEANFGGELDVVDYGVGRFAFEANYQVLMGKELRAFDPNQGNYVLAGLLSARLGPTEVAAVLYHQSRHLSDRPKDAPVAWNAFGARVRRRFPYRAATLDARADLRTVTQKSTVDYSWELDVRVRADAPVRAGVGVLAAAGVRHYGVDGTVDRSGQTGYRVEAGIRLEGRAGAVELFVGAERRVDPHPLEFGTADWVTAGFRLMSRQE